MTLPEILQSAIERVIDTQSVTSLTHAREEVSQRYRYVAGAEKRLQSDTHRLSYLATRLPATYEAISSVLQEIKQRMPEFAPTSLLDIGAGPGTGLWAATEAFETLERCTLIEQDASFVEIGQRLALEATTESIRGAQWIQADMTQHPKFVDSEIVLLSYSLGELDPVVLNAIVKASWQASTRIVVIIEPGTPRGYETILSCRDRLIEEGGTIIAPCPHQLACPWAGTNRWCHFATRVSRTSLHRQVKGGTLGYEDEKYSYVVATKGEEIPAVARIVGHPQKKSGHVNLELCMPQGIEKVVVSRKQGDLYHQTRKADWGDAFEVSIK